MCGLVVSLVLWRIDCCNSLLAGLPQSMAGKLQRVQNCAARLVIRALPHVHISSIFRHLHWLPVRARISYKTACLCFNAITSSTLLISLTFYICTLLLDLFAPVTFYICTLLLDLFAPVPTPAYSKSHSISARQKVIVLTLTLVFLSGIYCHCTLEMLQLFTPSSLL